MEQTLTIMAQETATFLSLFKHGEIHFMLLFSLHFHFTPDSTVLPSCPLLSNFSCNCLFIVATSQAGGSEKLYMMSLISRNPKLGALPINLQIRKSPLVRPWLMAHGSWLMADSYLCSSYLICASHDLGYS